MQRMDQESLPRSLEGWKTSEFLDAGSYNRNERAGNWRLGMGLQGGVEKED